VGGVGVLNDSRTQWSGGPAGIDRLLCAKHESGHDPEVVDGHRGTNRTLPMMTGVLLLSYPILRIDKVGMRRDHVVRSVRT